MKLFSPSCLKWTSFVISLLLILLGTLTVVFWRNIVDKFLYSQMALSNKGTVGYKMWEETPLPLYLEIYLWNHTNAEEVINSNWTTKLKLQQCGPYTYIEKHFRKGVILNDNNTVTFNTTRLWQFDPDKSEGSFDDKLMIINPIVLTMAEIVKNKHILVRRGMHYILEHFNMSLVITKTADEFLFKGYDDPLITVGLRLKIIGFNIPNEKFGWFYGRNGSVSYDGVTNMFTGKDDVNKTGRILSWNYQTNTGFYDGNCGQVGGTTGELWYPLKNAKTVSMFIPDVCSIIQAEYQGDVTRLGLKGHHYVGAKNIFDNGTLYPEMACFVKEGDKLPSGSRNVSLCKFNTPAFVSYPHFLNADSSYSENFDGLEPDPKTHVFEMALEPKTGIPLFLSAAFQVNMKLQSVTGVDILEGAKMMFVPMLWFKESAEVSESIASMAKLMLVMGDVGELTGYAIIVIGCLLLVVTPSVAYRKKLTCWRNKKYL